MTDPIKRLFDPRGDAARFAQVVQSIAREGMQARATLASRGDGPLALISDWQRAALLASAVVLMFTVPALVALPPSKVVGDLRVVSAADALGVPRPFTRLLRAQATPAVADLYAALTGTAAP